MVNIEEKSQKLFEERSFEKNKDFDIHNVKSGDKVRWKCKKGHERKAMINSRTKGTGCPYCSNQKVLKGYNDLATTHPDLAKEWNYERNGNITPDLIVSGSNKKYWWRCSKGHEYESVLSDRVGRGRGCPYCSNQKVLKGYNDLATTNPELLEERDFKKNERLGYSPYDIPKGASINVWWKCKKGHEWQSIVYGRTSGRGCPFCSKGLHTSFPEKTILYYFLKINDKIVENYKNENIGISELDIFIPNKKIGIEYDGNKWHSDKERDLLKNDICKRNLITLYRIREHGCPILNSTSIDFYVNDGDYKELGIIIENLINKIYGVILNIDINRDKADIRKFMDLNTKNSADKLPYEIIKQWDYEKNKGLEPSSFSIGTHKKVWRICDKGHSYECSIANRSNGRGCPYCSNNKLLCGFNDLKTINPELAKEWNYERNGKLLPNGFFSKSGKKVRRKCKKGHEWEAKISNRANGRGCPYCAGKLK